MTLMPEPTEPKKHRQGLNVLFSDEEIKAVKNHAEVRNLPNSTFVRFLIAGAIAQGGGTLDRLLSQGENLIPVRQSNRQGHNVKALWASLTPGHRILKADPRWQIKLQRTHAGGTRGMDREDRSNWWWLYNTERPGDEPVPMAFTSVEAMRAAMAYIERKDHGETPPAS